MSKKGDGWGFSTININMGADVEVGPIYVLFHILLVGGEGYSLVGFNHLKGNTYY